MIFGPIRLNWHAMAEKKSDTKRVVCNPLTKSRPQNND
jgi:hypothetical protein